MATKQNKSTMHPRYRLITVITPNGQEFKTRSTYSKDILKLEIDPSTHPAWTRDSSFLNTKSSHIADFNRKYEGLDFLSSPGTEE
jgi:large subunit ribosomal protein L31